MFSLSKLFRKLFGGKKPVNELEIAFHKDANQYGTHGTLRASHKAQRIDKASIRFVFVGVAVPPPLSPEIFAYIWERANAEGYIPTELMTYGRVIEVSSVDSAKYLTSPERRRMESMHTVANPA